MRATSMLIGAALAIGPHYSARAQQDASGGALTRQSLQSLPPGEVARRALGALTGNVRSASVDDLNQYGGPLGNVTLTFQPQSMSAGICVETVLTVFFTAVDPERTFGPNPETAPVRSAGFRTEERFRVIGPIADVAAPTARSPAADRACAAGRDDDLYFSTDGIGPLDLGLQAIERSLVDLRGESVARGLIGKLVSVSMHECPLREANCMRLTARISEHGYRRDPDGYDLTIENVRYNSRHQLVSTGHSELVQGMIITH